MCSMEFMLSGLMLFSAKRALRSSVEFSARNLRSLAAQISTQSNPAAAAARISVGRSALIVVAPLNDSFIVFRVVVLFLGQISMLLLNQSRCTRKRRFLRENRQALAQ